MLSTILKDQLLRASSSVVLNTAEGFGSASRGVKRRHYEIARGKVRVIAEGNDIRLLPEAGGHR